MSRLGTVFILAGLWTGCLVAQPALEPPLLGVLRDSNNQLRPVYGVAGNFILGPAELGGVMAQAFSGRSGLIKTDRQWLRLDDRGAIAQSYPAAAGPGLFGFDPSGLAALCYSPETRQLWNVREDALYAIETELAGGEVLALALAEPDLARLVVRREDGLWLVGISPETGRILREESLFEGQADAASLPRPGVLVFANGEELFIRDLESGDEKHLRLPAPAQRLDLMGDGWLFVGQPDGAPPVALRIGGDRESLYRLPLPEVVE